MSSVDNHVAVTPEEHVKGSSRSAVYAWWSLGAIHKLVRQRAAELAWNKSKQLAM